VTAAVVGSVVVLQRFPAKSMGGESLSSVEVGADGLVGDREWAVYGADGKLASGKHTRRFRRMDRVFQLTASREGDETLVTLPGRPAVLAGSSEADGFLSDHFGEPVALRRETSVPHQDAAALSLVGTATLTALGAYEGDGRALDPRHLRTNVVVETDEPYLEESWLGRDVVIGPVRLRPTEPTERCRMVGVAQVGLPARRDLLRAISDHHHLLAGVYADVVRPGTVRLGDTVTVA